MAMKAKRIRPTKMWADIKNDGEIWNVHPRRHDLFDDTDREYRVRVILECDYLALKRAAKGKR